MPFAERIKSLRTKERYSQVQFGQLIGVKPNTIWRWENNKAKPDFETVIRIAQALKTTSAYLLGETDSPTQTQEKRSNTSSTATPKTEEKSSKVDTGMMTYEFSDHEKISMPAIPELIPTFQKIVADKLRSLQQQQTKCY